MVPRNVCDISQKSVLLSLINLYHLNLKSSQLSVLLLPFFPTNPQVFLALSYTEARNQTGWGFLHQRSSFLRWCSLHVNA